MKINARISAGANRSLTRMPLPALDMADCLDANGKLDCAKAIKAFPAEESEPGYRPFMHSSRDDSCVYFSALTFLELMHDAYREVVANPSADCQERETCREAEIRRINARRLFCERRTASGFCSPCKFDCPHCKGGKCCGGKKSCKGGGKKGK